MLQKLPAEVGAKLVIDTDTHEPRDLITDEQAQNILLGAGVNRDAIAEIMVNSKNLAARAIAAWKK